MSRTRWKLMIGTLALGLGGLAAVADHPSQPGVSCTAPVAKIAPPTPVAAVTLPDLIPVSAELPAAPAMPELPKVAEPAADTPAMPELPSAPDFKLVTPTPAADAPAVPAIPPLTPVSPAADAKPPELPAMPSFPAAPSLPTPNLETPAAPAIPTLPNLETPAVPSFPVANPEVAVPVTPEVTKMPAMEVKGQDLPLPKPAPAAGEILDHVTPQQEGRFSAGSRVTASTPEPAPAADVKPAAAATVAASEAKLKVLLHMGDERPKFEVREGEVIYLRVTSEKVEVKTPTDTVNANMSTMRATGQVRFVTPGGEGTCQELAVVPGTGQVTVTGQVSFTYNWGKVETTVTGEKMTFGLGGAPKGAGNSR